MAHDCLARSITCAKRASLGPALLALLPLRRLAAATLRERPVLLRLNKLAELLLPPIDLCSEMGQKEAQTHTKHNVTVAVAVSTVAGDCATVDPWERHRPCRLCSLV